MKIKVTGTADLHEGLQWLCSVFIEKQGGEVLHHVAQRSVHLLHQEGLDQYIHSKSEGHLCFLYLQLSN